MTANILLCLFSSVIFCFCIRGLMSVTIAARVVAPSLGRFGFSNRAWRVARSYLAFAFTVMGLATLTSAIFNFVELFTAF